MVDNHIQKTGNIYNLYRFRKSSSDVTKGSEEIPMESGKTLSQIFLTITTLLYTISTSSISPVIHYNNYVDLNSALWTLYHHHIKPTLLQLINYRNGGLRTHYKKFEAEFAKLMNLNKQNNFNWFTVYWTRVNLMIGQYIYYMHQCDSSSSTDSIDLNENGTNK